MRDIINLKLNLDYSKRILCVSDIHGGYDLLDKCLKRVNYNPEKDYLIILGDVINRGEHSLESINYIIKLCKNKNVYMIKGNHEEDFYNRNDLQYDMIKTYVTKKTSLLYDLLENVYTDNMNEEDIFNYAYTHYKYIFDFINSLPDMIETDKYIFVHSAYFDENNINTIVRTADYLKYNYKSKDKWIIVGHYPSANYPEMTNNVFNCNPIVLNDRKICLIDGGKGTKDFGQVNLLMIENDKFKSIYEDWFKKIEVINDQEESGDVSITYKDPYVRLIEEKGEFVLCEYHGKKVYLEKRLVYLDKNDEYNARNSTNHFLKIKKGDIVSLIYQGETVSQIKKDGIIGYAYNTNLKLL